MGRFVLQNGGHKACWKRHFPVDHCKNPPTLQGGSTCNTHPSRSVLLEWYRNIQAWRWKKKTSVGVVHHVKRRRLDPKPTWMAEKNSVCIGISSLQIFAEYYILYCNWFPRLWSRKFSLFQRRNLQGRRGPSFHRQPRDGAVEGGGGMLPSSSLHAPSSTGSHSFSSLAILEAIFLKPMDVPEMRLKRTPFSDRRGSLHTSISHCTRESVFGSPCTHSSRKRSRCS